ncbi:MAG: GNAT family N-acetyltransferase [Mucilaginibacter sp.]|uniref:GNAT family N-acetyltransferase n=1 Tax=Mucilaginibacter sp. TaxID=1882438 RepID=UPI0032661479
MSIINYTAIRQLRREEPVPYKLLLLADEQMQAIERYIKQCDIYVIESGDKAIAVYAFYPVNGYTAEIKAIAVDEVYQNQGIGKRMLNQAESVAQEKGFRELIIGTPTIAQKQIAIYQKAGFELFDVKKDFFITHYSEPIFEDGTQLKDMAMLRKQLTIMQILPASPADYPELVKVWEASVRATHHFVPEEDIVYFRTLVPQYFDAVNLCVIRHGDKISGFLGTGDQEVQMLFLHPDWRGKGLGKFFIEFAIKECGVTKVEANEQNAQAVGFYERMGFKVIGRAELDYTGRPYPLLFMELNEK